MRTALALALLTVLFAGCGKPVAGSIDFGEDATTADAAATLAPSATPAVGLTPSGTPTVGLTPPVTPTASTKLTPTVAPTPIETPTVAPTRNRTPTVAPTPNETPTVGTKLTPTAGITPNETPTAGITPNGTPTVSYTPNGTPTALKLTPNATPSLIPTLDLTPSPTATLDLTPTPTLGTPSPTPTEFPIGTPGPNALLYQGFWSGQPHAQADASGWYAGRSWTTDLGMLVSDGSTAGPSFAAPARVIGGALTRKGGSYAVEAQFGLTGSHEHAGFGVYLRETTHLMPAMAAGPTGPGDSGRWRGGIANGHAFLLGEDDLPTGATPADLVVPKSVSSAPFASANEWVTLRLEARANHYTLLIDGRRVLDVDDARYSQGTNVGLWTDNAPVRVRDFRLYTLS